MYLQEPDTKYLVLGAMHLLLGTRYLLPGANGCQLVSGCKGGEPHPGAEI